MVLTKKERIFQSDQDLVAYKTYTGFISCMDLASKSLCVELKMNVMRLTVAEVFSNEELEMKPRILQGFCRCPVIKQQ